MPRFTKQLAIPKEVEEMVVAGMDVTVVEEMVAVELVDVVADAKTHNRQHHNLLQLCFLPNNMHKQW